MNGVTPSLSRAELIVKGEGDGGKNSISSV